MKAWFLTLTIIAAAPPALAAECGKGSPDVLRLVDWSATKADRGTVVTLTYENAAPKGIKMVEGTAWFSDALDRSIGGIGLNEDVRLTPGSSATEEFRMVGNIERLAEVDKTDAAGIICVEAVLYDDGSKEAFTEPASVPGSLADEVAKALKDAADQ